MKKKMYFSIGVSGSGKSFYYRNRFLDDFNDIRREVCGDVSDCSQDYKVWKMADSRLKETLNTHGYGIFDATGVSQSGRNKFLKKYVGVHKTAIVFEPNVSLSKERIKNDISTGVDRSKVPMFVIDRQFESFKNSVIKDAKWDGLWNKVAKKKALENLKNEFDEVVIV